MRRGPRCGEGCGWEGARATHGIVVYESYESIEGRYGKESGTKRVSERFEAKRAGNEGGGVAETRGALHVDDPLSAGPLIPSKVVLDVTDGVFAGSSPKGGL